MVLIHMVIVLHASAKYGQFLLRIEVRRRFLANYRSVEHGDNRYCRKHSDYPNFNLGCRQLQEFSSEVVSLGK